MSLTAGARIGPYEITGTLGAGGMGEVYRARDPRLGRDVALKVLPDAFAGDAERLARFQREAQVLASLTHPNIGAIYGLEETGTTRALVLELIEGDTLADRIARGPIPVDEAVPTARQIAEALEAAHEQGIVHRDLKPANIKLSADGVVRVLDFGLAKLTQASEAGGAGMAGGPGLAGLTQSPTITTPAHTAIGVILGTAAYMAPEQAKGRPADKRSDVWAFGCVFYEMLTGRRAFEGEDVSDTLASVLKTEPDWNALPGELSPALRMLVTSCLTKDRRKRMADIGAALFVLEHQAHLSAGGTTPAGAPLARRRLWRRAASWAAVVAVAMAAGAMTAWRVKPAPVDRVERFAVTLGPADRLGSLIRRLVAVSPDGTRVVYVANNRLNLKTLDALDPVAIAGTEATGSSVVAHPLFSPDGQWVAYWQNSQLKKIRLTGGPPVVVASSVPAIFSATWGTDDAIVYTGGSEIWKVPAAGGTPEVLVKRVPGESIQCPQLLPGGEGVLFTVATSTNWNAAQIVVQSLADGTRTVVVDGGHDARYLPTGHLVYHLNGALFAAPFDLRSRRRTGEAVSLVDGVADAGTASGGAHYAVSEEGTLVYVPGGAENELRTLVWIDRQGREEAIPAPPRPYVYARLSPDGRRIALDVRDEAGDVWIWDLVRQALMRLTFDPGLNRGAIWSPDGRRIAFSVQHEGVENAAWQAADGSGPAELLTRESTATFPASFSPDGKQLFVLQPAGTPPRDISVVALGGDGRPQVVLNAEYDEVNPELSPDGQWLAYESVESGRAEIYVRPFPEVASGRWQISTDGGTRPAWAPNGRELFYWVVPDTLMAVDVQTHPTFVAGTPRQIVKGPYVAPLNGRPYDVSADSARFLLLKTFEPPAATAQRPRVVVVQNWFEELKRRVPVP